MVKLGCLSLAFSTSLCLLSLPVKKIVIYQIAYVWGKFVDSGHPHHMKHLHLVQRQVNPRALLELLALRLPPLRIADYIHVVLH